MVISAMASIIISMRPRQWVKNVIIFAALVFDRQIGPAHWDAMFRTVVGFVIFCLLSGVVYIINDIVDLEADRAHPKKKDRPISSGRLPVKTASITSVLFLIIVFPISYRLSPSFFAVALMYFSLNIVYSFWLKHVPLLDVFSIALGFVLRVAAGITLIQVTRFSPWLYVVITLGALYIGFGKRRAELALLTSNAYTHRKVLDGYTTAVLDQLIAICAATVIIAYSLYTFSAPNLPDNHIMMLTIPFVLYGVFRYLFLIQDSVGAGEPEEIFLTDRPIQGAVLLWGISILLIFYIY